MATAQVDESFEELLDYIKEQRGFDFTGYKRPSLRRRIEHRMQAVGAKSFAQYQERLELRPGEFAELFDTILINVTSFFRDPTAWDAIRDHVIPSIVDAKAPGDPIRVWSTGCATGEEAYTAAILLAEHLGEAEFKDRVKIYATDVDEDALNTGRHASYSPKTVVAVPDPVRERYFEETLRGFVFRKDLRRSVVFGRNDLIQDPPISRIDLLLSRNTLMYFNAETQHRILGSFHFALTDEGFLVLGKSEVLATRSKLFTAVDRPRRVYRKVSRPSMGERLVGLVDTDGAERTLRQPESSRRGEMREAAFELGPTAQLVVGDDGTLTMANHHARSLFGISPKDLGRPLNDFEVSYRPLELRSLIEQARRDGHPLSVRHVEWQTSRETRYLDVQVSPLVAPAGSVGTSILFADVTRYQRLNESFERSKHELETAYEELQATAEELETTNEELQSTNEELETTNEELQSTNEELETMNEELQSTNDELETMNDELQQSSHELSELNGFLESILTSFGGGVVVVDPKLRVLAWNDRSDDLWGLRGDEVEGEHLLDLDIGLPVDKLRAPIKAVLSAQETHAELHLAATNRRGCAVEVLVKCTPLVGTSSEPRGVILVMEEIRRGDDVG